MLLRTLILSCILFAMGAASGEARAAQLLFALDGDQTIRFTIDTNPMPDRIVVDGFIITDTVVEIDGSNALREVGFVRALSGGGLVILDTPFNLAGPQLFSGSFAQPTLLAGNYRLTGFNDPTITYRLSVTDIGAVPEPETWLLLLTGFGLLAAGMRTRRFRATEPASTPQLMAPAFDVRAI